ncbi:EAL domain-containing protein [Rhodococcus sp. UNC23MFCrub1.1]|uniref:EAL domain-containing protein n=1 Tax=Rhodococcus sp. UNC23MFCrub1.1 TaxID=1449068 RepID=UPI00069055CF|nr:EAL domain-containing protein [Rhodococcus sp. UNC23MFCrub1.1]
MNRRLQENTPRPDTGEITSAVTPEEIVAVLRRGGPSTVFQPVVEAADLRVVGYEALARFPTGTPGPEQWFASATQHALAGALEGAALLRALDHADALPPELFLAVNLSPAALTADPTLIEPLRHAARHRRIVLEVSEHSTVTEVENALGLLDDLRAAGVVLALDDVCAGHSGLRQVITVRPDIVKLDAFVTRDIDTDPFRSAITAATITLAGQFDMTVVVEGIETDAELRTVRELGAHLLQGCHPGQPAPDHRPAHPPDLAPPAKGS